jgi:hypothetical protein
MTKGNISPITVKELKALQKKLKELDGNWMSLLIEKVKKVGKTKKDKNLKEVNGRKIYNIFNGLIVDNYWRMLVYEYGSELRKELENKVLVLREQFKEQNN